MKILVVGLGSMGKRRVRLLQSSGIDLTIAGVDASPARRQESERLYGIATFDSLPYAIDSFLPDAAFVSAPPAAHNEITHELLLNGIHVFSEINLLSDGYDDNIALAKEKHLVLFLSSTPMYRKEIEYITDAVRNRDAVRYRYHVGQYLPDWHPWESYTDFFVGNKLTNGIRELLAIELPWLTGAFGEIVSFTSNGGKLTGLAIDYYDCYAMTVEHKNGVIGQLTIDLVCRKPIRELLVYGEEIFLRWGGTPDSLVNYDIPGKEEISVRCYDDVLRDNRYSDNIIENAYAAEIDDFFGQISGHSAGPRHSFEADKEILALIDRIEGKML